ncbi:MAG: hypothetical protein GXO87_09555 [Chlorobi bacterium]|nr:hypothetical protein [Chlorobiota bacterium]
MRKESLSLKLFFGKKREETELTQKKLLRYNAILLVAFVANMFIPRGPATGMLTDFFNLITVTVIVYASSISLDFSKKFKNIIYPLSAVTVMLLWLTNFFESIILSSLSYFTLIAYFFIIGFAMIVHLLGEKKVTASMLLNAVNSYLFLGYIFSFILLFGELINKIWFGANHLLLKFPETFAPKLQHYLYFSFVTLTTLGYGDITPISEFSQMLSVVIAVSGQIYMTMLLAFLVGKYISESMNKDNN